MHGTSRADVPSDTRDVPSWAPLPWIFYQDLDYTSCSAGIDADQETATSRRAETTLPAGRVIGSVGITLPAQRFQPEDERRQADCVIAAARAITAHLSGTAA